MGNVRRFLGLAVAGLLLLTLSACGGGKSASKSSFCDSAKKIKNADSSLGNAFSDNDPKALDAANTLLKDLKDTAPSEIKDDAATVADVFKQYVEAFKKAGGDQTKLVDALKGLDEKKFTAAANNVESYVSKNCGFSLSSDSGSKATSSSNSKSRSSSSDYGYSDFSDLSDLSSLSDYTDQLSSAFSDLSSFSNLSDYSSLFSDLSSFSSPKN